MPVAGMVRSNAGKAFEQSSGPDAALPVFREAPEGVVVEGADYAGERQGAVQHVYALAGGNPEFSV